MRSVVVEKLETKNKKRTRKVPVQAGMSFLEIMIVVIIMAGIAAIVGPRLFGKLDDAKIDQAKIQMQSLSSALDLYHLDNHVFPSSEQGLSSLMSKPEVGNIPVRWKGPYLKGNKVPMDPWGNDYHYESDGQTFEIISYGNDGARGGSDSAGDISSKEL